jgi:small-conductance mechanosensitive channel
MMVDALLATILIILAAAAWRLMPARPAWLSPIAIFILFALLTAVLIRAAGSPFVPDFGLSSPGVTLWHQIIMAGWWIIAAKSLLAVAELVLSFGRHSRETKLGSELVAAAVYLGAVLHVINTVFSVPIGGLVATSGVIAIVLGLALQNTLADVFSGIAVGVEGPIAVGDRVWIEGGLEGEIVEINWRSIRIRTDGNDIAIVPHSVVAKSRLINRSYPTTRRGDSVTISVAPDISPGVVTDLIKRAALLCPAVLRDPAPSVALIELGRKSNRYEAAFSVSASNLLWSARSSLLKEIARQFRYAGIKPAQRLHPDSGGVVEDIAGSADARDETVFQDGQSPERLIDELPLFHGLPRDCRQKLAGHLVRHVIEVQHIVFAQGATEASLFIIASGVLEVTRETSERKLFLGRIGPGDYIGEIGMLTGAPHAATVTALTPCVVYELRKEHVASLLTSQPDLVSAFEASARRGQELIARAVAAGVNPHDSSPGQLLARIRAFFNIPS